MPPVLCFSIGRPRHRPLSHLTQKMDYGLRILEGLLKDYY